MAKCSIYSAKHVRTRLAKKMCRSTHLTASYRSSRSRTNLIRQTSNPQDTGCNDYPSIDTAMMLASPPKFRLANDQRAHTRIRYCQTHMAAPYDGQTTPLNAAYAPVRFFDISQGGFSFITKREPTSELIVVCMQVREVVAYLTARIMNCREREFESGYIVGCQILMRSSAPPDKLQGQ
jgi:hypothetical protein